VVVKDGKADRRQVTLGVRTAGWAEIQGGGIDAGDQVVVVGWSGCSPVPCYGAGRRAAPRRSDGRESTAAAAAQASPAPGKR